MPAVIHPWMVTLASCRPLRTRERPAPRCSRHIRSSLSLSLWRALERCFSIFLCMILKHSDAHPTLGGFVDSTMFEPSPSSIDGTYGHHQDSWARVEPKMFRTGDRIEDCRLCRLHSRILEAKHKQRLTLTGNEAEPNMPNASLALLLAQCLESCRQESAPKSLNPSGSTEILDITHRPLSSSFLWFICRIL